MLIVIDGIDGSGKTVQFNLLVERLKKEGYDVETADFPQYGKKSAGPVEEYLTGAYGTPEEVGPYRASILFAVDRYAFSKAIKDWIASGKIVVSNRYVGSNMGHQGGKIADHEERKKYFAWCDDLEFNIFGIPRPDINFFLHMPTEIGQKLVELKTERKYLEGGKKDIHEDSLEHLKKAEQTYLEIVDTFPNYIIIESTEGGEILSKEVIHEKIWKELMAKITK
ncbi:deoxynucleoside kinase [Patescibacteria group bacterium]|nr:deoxynucleoside kinase [Patescibacteria group bacterium]